jgi:peptidyl-prolyl cis-trans isomerase C
MRPRFGGRRHWSAVQGVSSVAALLLALGAAQAWADTPKDEAVARVGERRVTQAELERRLASMPHFQLRTFGRTASQITATVLEETVVPELLLDLEAERRQLKKEQDVAFRLRQLLSAELERTLQREAEEAGPSEVEIARYFEEHRAELSVPRRVRVWRIVVENEALARKIIGETTGAGAVSRWSAFAREHSLDKATKDRDGELGFVRPDGTTDVPTVRVDPRYFAAVDQVRDGEVVPEPLQVYGHFAVLWRRGSLPAREALLETERHRIRARLVEASFERLLGELVTRLEREHVKRGDVTLVERVTTPPFGRSSGRSE